MGLPERVAAARRSLGRGEARSITTIDDYAAALGEFAFNGVGYGPPVGIQQTLTGGQAERTPNDLTGYATAAYASNGPIFALMALRLLVFSAIRFQYQRLNGGRPSGLFGDTSLSILETPWVGGTTQDMLARMILDVDLAGNSYWARVGDELVRLRPDWVGIVLEPRRVRDATVGYRRLGYIYEEGGLTYSRDSNPATFLADEVAHFAPYPDPLATYRGMSWLTPVLRELANDKLMSTHQQKYFENGATPNMVVSLDAAVKKEDFARFKAAMEEGHTGVHNAYRTLYLGGGADVTVVGSDFKQMDFTSTQGRVETRLAAAAGVPPVIVGFSEGLQGSSLNAGNYASSRRRMADATMHPLWQNVAGSLGTLVPAPGNGSRLWYDARDVPFLREDESDTADIQAKKAQTIRQLVDAGYEPDSVVAAVEAEDYTLLKHTGLFSVQLQPPGTGQPAAPANQPSTTEAQQ
jgi:phage portal protein BeeE